MQRRKFLQNTVGTGLALLGAGRSVVQARAEVPGTGRMTGMPGAGTDGQATITSGPKAPLTIYNNWSSYDELSDNIPLTEELAMRELQEVIRLKRSGVQIDYYMMDAFWFDKTGGYRVWHRQHWPEGPDKWLNACKENGILPGMWFSTNLIATHSGRFLEPVPEWQDSVGSDPNILCLFSGGYRKHLGETLQLWYDKGVRAFKFDFAYFNAATRVVEETHLPGEIEEMNRLAFMDLLKLFRAGNPDVLITGYNGFGGDLENTFTPFRKTVDSRWLDVFDTIYCGDPRFSDVPMMNVWRSQDSYSDHMVRQFAFNGLPLRRIDNCGFMIGKTGTCYYRGLHAWKGMLILELARGGWVNVFHGNLELLGEEESRWFARAQGLFLNLQRYGLWSTFGAIPGQGLPYGFTAQGSKGTVLTVVNPSQTVAMIALPAMPYTQGAILYADGGFKPQLHEGSLQLGPEQLAVIGLDEYAADSCHLGVDDAIRIPAAIEKLSLAFKETGRNRFEASLLPPPGKSLRILFRQLGADGLPHRSWGGAPPDGRKMDDLLIIRARQGKKPVPLILEYDKMIWSGLSWAVVEIRPASLNPHLPVTINCSSAETEPFQLKAEVYALTY
ncbi:MAG TPA: hypothetical protein VL832_01675 [Puia sp.]|nr:hypothetical protein [Puia sp.]